MKKALALVLMGALVAGTLAGCEKDDKKTIGVALPSKELARCLKDEEYLTKDLKATHPRSSISCKQSKFSGVKPPHSAKST